jgi:quinol monooxygenase YgiN
MIPRIRTVPSRRDQMIEVLQTSAANMPGCLSYIVGRDQSDENIVWVTEAWESQTAHDASLSLRQVQDAIPRARPLIANFERLAVTEPVWGTGVAGQ